MPSARSSWRRTTRPGYLELGIWAELSGDFDDADQFYRKTLKLLPTFDVVRLGTRVSLMDPPGRLLTRAGGGAARIAPAQRRAGGRRAGPPGRPARSGAAPAGGGASRAQPRAGADQGSLAERGGGRRRGGREAHAWNGDAATAIERFERAEQLDERLAEVGWLLADARLTTSLPLGATMTDQTVVAQARETWERWAVKVGPPRASTSWAYLTRAMIADLGTQQPEANRLVGIWEALQYVEKAILHDGVDASRWGYAAQYLRHVHLDELALEAVERGYKLDSGNRQVLTERLAQFAYRGRLEEADQVGEELVTMFGNDPWVSAARAWMALHSDRKTRYSDGLGLLEMPIAGGNDPSWYYEMRALCHVGLGEIDAARADFRDLLKKALPVDGATKCRLSVAAVALQDPEQAAQLVAGGVEGSDVPRHHLPHDGRLRRLRTRGGGRGRRAARPSDRACRERRRASRHHRLDAAAPAAAPRRRRAQERARAGRPGARGRGRAETGSGRWSARRGAPIRSSRTRSPGTPASRTRRRSSTPPCSP